MFVCVLPWDRLLACLFLLFFGFSLTTVSSAQEPSTDRSALQAVIEALSSQNNQPPAPDQPRDPTMPSDRILEQLPRPELPSVDNAPTRSNRNASRSPSLSSGLPALPTIELRGLVMSTPTRGKAMLNVGGRSLSINLVSRDQQTRTPIPATQFAQFQPALKARAAALADPTQADAVPAPPIDLSFEMSVQSSFFVDGVLFNLESFSEDALVLQALPHKELILVRGD